MSYRPEGWANPYPDKPDDYDWDLEDDVRPAAVREVLKAAYEAGADAMLVGLRKEGERVEEKDEDGFYPWADSGIALVKGHVVFIPDEDIVSEG